MTGIIERAKRQKARKNSAGTVYGPYAQLNVIEGTNITLTVAYDTTNDELDLQIASSGGVAEHALDGASHSAGTLGDIVYGGAAGDWGLLPGNTSTTKNFLTQTGAGTVSAAPAWDTIAQGDIPDVYLLNSGDVGTGVYDLGGATSVEIPNGAGGTTVDAAGEICVDTTSDTVNFFDGAAEKVLTPIDSKAATIETPTATEDVSLFFTDDAITITKMVAVLVGSATPSVTWTIRHGTDRSAAGAEVVTGGTVTTSVTTGSVVTSFNDATVVADSFLWLETTAASGTVTSINVTIFYTQDP